MPAVQCNSAQRGSTHELLKNPACFYAVPERRFVERNQQLYVRQSIQQLSSALLSLNISGMTPRLNPFHKAFVPSSVTSDKRCPSIESKPLPETVKAGPRESEILRLEIISTLPIPMDMRVSYLILASDSSLSAVRRNTAARRARAGFSSRSYQLSCRNVSIRPTMDLECCSENSLAVFFRCSIAPLLLTLVRREDFTKSPVSTAYVFSISVTLRPPSIYQAGNISYIECINITKSAPTI
jgi:hypothetical protein